MLRPEGFLVVEPRPLLTRKSSNAYVYLVKRCCLDTRKAGLLLTRELMGRKFEYLGLKDTNAIVYQYYVIYDVDKPLNHIVKKNFKAWFVQRGKSFAPKERRGNIFRVSVITDDPDLFCDEFKKLEWIPGYFGPQRFGIERPNTHIQGLYLSKNYIGDLIHEFNFRYPFENRETLGFYEKQLINSIVKKTSFLLNDNKWWQRFLLEALQSYIFNKALSKILRESNVTSFSESAIRIRCINKVFKVPASRLPAPGMKLKSRWADILKEVIEDEGLHEILIRRDLDLRPTLRPLLYPICKIYCLKTRDNLVEVSFSLPPGAYATVALWQISNIIWV